MSSRLRSTVAMLSGGEENSAPPDTGWLTDRFRQLVAADTVEWSVQYRLLRRVGSGGQGVVYLAERLAVHNLTLPVALKVFSPESHPTVEHYRREMERIARIAGDLVLLQHDHLLDVYNFVLCDGVYVMVMEYVDGFDLHQLVQTEMAAQTRAGCDPQRWEQLTRVVFSEGKQLAFTPGIAVSILRHCLAAVGAMHRLRIVHGDLKPANIMVTRSGTAKVVDFGSAVVIEQDAPYRKWTPQYAAPEVLRGAACTPQSDLASLGYVLVEMLAGQSPFADLRDVRSLLEAKEDLPSRLWTLLPAEAQNSELLMNFIRRLVAPQPRDRFESAEAAELSDGGAAAFLRQLVRGDLSSEYANELRLWLAGLESPAAAKDELPQRLSMPSAEHGSP